MASSVPTLQSFKDQLYGWLGKKKIRPDYRDLPLAGSGQFVVQLVVSGYSYKPEGRGLKKTEAQEEAARKFVQWLQHGGMWSQTDSSLPRAAATPPKSSHLFQGTDRSQSDQNPKSELNMLLQSMGVRPGTYTTEPKGNGLHECVLTIDLKTGREKFTNSGQSKKEAECACAREALRLQLRGTQSARRPGAAVSVQADGPPPPPPLARSGSVPAASSRPWLRSRPTQANPISMLNEFLQQNGVPVVKYEPQQSPGGGFGMSGRIAVPSQGINIEKSGYDSSKADAKKRCAEELIGALEGLRLIDLPPAAAVAAAGAAAVADDVSSTVNEVLRGVHSSLASLPPLGVAAAPLSPPAAAYPSYSLPGHPAPGHLIVNMYHAPATVYQGSVPPSPGGVGGALASDAVAFTPSRAPAPPLPSRAPEPPLSSRAPDQPLPSRAPEQPLPPSRPRPDRLAYLFQSSESVGDRHIYKASMNIGKYRKSVGVGLGLNQPEIDNCRYMQEDPHEVNRRILRCWREKAGMSGATLGALCGVLWECGEHAAVEILAEVTGAEAAPQP